MDSEYRRAVEQRIGRPFEQVQDQLIELFDEEWDDVVIVLETAATKSGRTHADVIADLIERSERKPAPQTRVKHSVIRWIGKPWRERDNPWERFKHKVPPVPPRTTQDTDDLDEWTPLRPEED